jgi:hypothetical protein
LTEGVVLTDVQHVSVGVIIRGPRPAELVASVKPGAKRMVEDSGGVKPPFEDSLPEFPDFVGGCDLCDRGTLHEFASICLCIIKSCRNLESY